MDVIFFLFYKLLLIVSFERNKMHEFLDFLFVLLTAIDVFKKSLSTIVN